MALEILCLHGYVDLFCIMQAILRVAIPRVSTTRDVYVPCHENEVHANM